MRLSVSFYTLLICLCSAPCFSQQPVQGFVFSMEQKPLYQVSVMLMNAIDSSLIDYGFTDKSGGFRLEAKAPRDAYLKFSHLGYETKYVTVLIPPGASVVLPDVFLKEKPLVLDEVIVRDESVLVLQDTVRHKVEYFKNGTEKTVEELLKKIPGVNVGSDGTIKVGNREIEKLMVDGDDLMEKGYRIMSKNMPAYPIAEVEVLKNFANNPLLKGIEESDKVAVNLKLDEQFKSVWFGNVQGGLGTGNFYELRGNLMNFGKKYKSYFITNLNNIGDNATGEVEHLVYPVRADEPAVIGDEEHAEKLLTFSPETPDFEQSRTNFNNAELVSLNNIFNPTSKLKIKTLAFFNWDELRFYRQTIDEILVPGLSFTNTEDYRLRTRKRIAYGKVDVTHKASTSKMLEATTRFSLDNFRGNSQLVFNDQSTSEGLNHEASLISQEVRLTNRIGEKKVFLVSGRFIRETAPQKYRINRFLYDGLFDDVFDPDSARQSSANTMYYAGINAHYMDRRKGGHLFEVQVGNEFRLDQLHTAFALIGDEAIAEYPPGYQNDTRYGVNDSYAKGKYRFKLKEFGFTGLLDVHHLYNQLENDGRSTQGRLLVNPGLGMDWRINKMNKIRTSYSYTTRNADIQDIYGNYILTGFRSFSRGTGSLTQLRGSDVFVNYEFGNWSDRFFANLFMIYNKGYRVFSTDSEIRQNWVQSERMLADNRSLLALSSNVDYFLPVINSNIKVELGYSRMAYQNRVNSGALRDVVTRGYNAGIEVRSGFSGIFNYHAGTKWRISDVRQPVQNSFGTNMSFLDLSFIFNPRVDVQVKGDRYFFDVTHGRNTYYFLDFGARYKIIESKLSLELSGKNLTNTDAFRSMSVSDLGSTTQEYRLLPRYVLLKCEFRF